MIETYFIENKDVSEQLNVILSKKLRTFNILRTENGKPYLEGDPLFFSVSHSKDRALIVLCDRPVGADIEVIDKRNYGAILSRMCAEERSEIESLNDFLKHWVVREAYIKMTGATLAKKLNGLKYTGGALYDNGKLADCELIHGDKDGCVYCICVDNEIKL